MKDQPLSEFAKLQAETIYWQRKIIQQLERRLELQKAINSDAMVDLTVPRQHLKPSLN